MGYSIIVYETGNVQGPAPQCDGIGALSIPGISSDILRAWCIWPEYTTFSSEGSSAGIATTIVFADRMTFLTPVAEAWPICHNLLRVPGVVATLLIHPGTTSPQQSLLTVRNDYDRVHGWMDLKRNIDAQTLRPCLLDTRSMETNATYRVGCGNTLVLILTPSAVQFAQHHSPFLPINANSETSDQPMYAWFEEHVPPIPAKHTTWFEKLLSS